MKVVMSLALAVAMIAGAAEAKTCIKGKPCGKTCIAATKTCRK